MNYTLFFVVFILQICDILSTNAVISNGGKELNPIMIYLMKKMGKYWYIPKVLFITGIVLLSWLWFPLYYTSVCTIIILMCMAIVADNLYQYSK